MKKVLLVFWHGYGDCVMAIPALKAYKLKHPDYHVGIATLRNRERGTVEILSPFVDEVFPVLSEPWNFIERGRGTLADGRFRTMQEANQIAISNNYSEIIEITTSPLMCKHKVKRIAMELGVYPLEDYIPHIDVSEEIVSSGNDLIKSFAKPVTFFHGISSRQDKTLDVKSSDYFKSKYFDTGTVIECGSNYFKDSIKYNPVSVIETCGLLKNVDQVFAVDSLVLHLAGAVDVPRIMALFTVTDYRQNYGDDIPKNVEIIKL